MASTQSPLVSSNGDATPVTMKVSDYIASFLASAGVRHVFMLTGGGAMHLNDALGHHPDLQCVCCHHEQAASFAAEAYARVSGKVGILNVTTGPGGINALNGVFGAWTDSIPMLVLSGQVRRDTIVGLSKVPGLRQLGDQEADVISMARGITKYAQLVTDPESIRYHLEKALHMAMSGRPGPVWLDIPIDVQGARIQPDTLRRYETSANTFKNPALSQVCAQVLTRISDAERPVLMIGSGVRIAGALPAFERVKQKLGIPVTTAWTAIDAVDSEDPYYCGRPGTVGDRAGNFTVQNSDVLLVVGCRLAIRQLSYNWGSFARCAYKIIVDIDPAELQKPMIRPDLGIEADAKDFFEELERQIDAGEPIAGKHDAWIDWCKQRVARYPVVQSHQRSSKNGERINPYYFLERLFDHLQADDVVACGDASASVIGFQVAKVKSGQRIFTNAGCASMGYDLPAAVGAAFTRPDRRVICLAGDGSVQLNIQELQTIAYHRLPVKLFVLNNDGYLSMRLTQSNFFKRLIGEGPRSGVSFPDMVKLGEAYGLKSMRIAGDGFEPAIDEALAYDGPVVCEVMLDPDQAYEPKLSSRQLPDGKIVSAALEDLAPFLPPEELQENLLIPRAE